MEHQKVNLFDLMQADLRQDNDCLWLRLRLPQGPELGECASAVAARIVAVRCAGTPYIGVWERAHAGIEEPNDGDREGYRAFIEPGFGSPDHSLSDDHIQGMVAEYLWYLVTLDDPNPHGQLTRVERPGWTASSGGADGLTVLRTAEGLVFFLWEIKKHTAQRAVSSTVRRAYGQLQASALRYLAQLTAVASERTDDEEEVRLLYARLVEHWQKQQDEAGVGIAVATSVDQLPNRCFSTMKDYFPGLAPRIRGLAVGLGSFPDFVEAVKERLWIAL